MADNICITIQSCIKSLYEDKCAGTITESVFLNLMDGYTKEQTEIEKKLPPLWQELDCLQDTAGEIESWIALVERYMNLDTLDRATVMGLIDHITVAERVKQDGKTAQNISIQYRFIGNLPQNTNEDAALIS